MDFIRAVACILVITYHALFHMIRLARPETTAPAYLGAIGLIGVIWFFVLSGMGISLSGKRWGGAKEFYAKRICAIYPPFWLAYLMTAAYLFLSTGRPIIPARPQSIPASFLGVDGLGMSMCGGLGGGYLVGEWFLGCLLVIYLIYPLIRKAMERQPLLTFGGSVAVAGLWLGNNAWLYRHCLSNSTAFYHPLFNLPFFIFGILIASYMQDKKKMKLLTTICAAAIAILLALHGAGLINIIQDQIPLRIAILALFPVIYVLYDKLKTGEIWRGIIGFLAKYSFLAFLFHHRIILSFLKSHSDDLWFLARSHGAINYVIGMIGVSYLAAYLVYPLAEKLSGRMRKKLLNQTPAANP